MAHAHVVQRLLDAGALLAGKTNLDQFACGLNGTRSPYGAVPNSFDADYVSGGSSSGSAYVVATGEVDFALGTDTAGSGRVPAGLNNIVGLKPSRGLLSARGVVPAAQSVDCVSIFARTVGTAALQVLRAATEFDAADPYGRSLDLAAEPFPARFRFGVPSALEFFGDDACGGLVRRRRSSGSKRWAAVAVTIDYAPLAEIAGLLYDSALVAERYAAVREFFDAHEAEVIEPVRGILAKGRTYSAADFVDAQTRLRALAQRALPMWRAIDLLPGADRAHALHDRGDAGRPRAAQPQPWCAYTNFVNLLDYAALSVPSSLRPDGLPFGITLIGRCGSDLQLAELGQRYHHASSLLQGATGVPLPAPVPVFALQGGRCRGAVGARGGGRRPPLGHAAQRPADRARRAAWSPARAPRRRIACMRCPAPCRPSPAWCACADGEGAAIEVEVWEMPVAHYGSFVALIPSPLGIGTLTLADGSSVQGFVCEALALAGAEDISHHGGWRRYIASRQAATA